MLRRKKKKRKKDKEKPAVDFSRKGIKPDTKSTALYQSRRFNQGRDDVAESIQQNTELGD